MELKGTEIDHPLIEQLVELDIDSQDGEVRIRPRSWSRSLHFAHFSNPIILAPHVREFGKKFLDKLRTTESFSFRPDTFVPVFGEAATQLDTRGVYYPDQVRDLTDRTVPIRRTIWW